ncbi:MAG: MFS transporter small subunit [Candidatus Angelobacter sp.]
MEDQIKKTPVVLVALAWLFVGLPWTWGVTQLWKNARKLFQSPPAATLPVAPVNPTAPPASTGK